MIEIHNSWEKALRHAVHQLHDIRFHGGDPGTPDQTTEPPAWQEPLKQS